MHFQRLAFHLQPAFLHADGVRGLALALAARRPVQVSSAHHPAAATSPMQTIINDLRMHVPFFEVVSVRRIQP